MKEEIKRQLRVVEETTDIKILYAVESGSRAWGFASTNSDWDVRYIYIHRPEWYLSIDHQKDSQEDILPNDIDLCGWEVRKALRLFRKSNPPLMEWLRSPLLYLENGYFANSFGIFQKNILILKIAYIIIFIWLKVIFENIFKKT
jgi:predicted nucleotidyltransferase